MTNYSEKFKKKKATDNLASKTLDMLTENIKPGDITIYHVPKTVL